MLRILVVEDDPDLLFLYQTALTQGGYDPVTAANATTAMAEIDQAAFDLILLDLNMPDHHGSVVIDYVRSGKGHKETHIVIITANDHWINEAVSRDVQDILIKPVAMIDIIALAHRLTD